MTDEDRFAKVAHEAYHRATQSWPLRSHAHSVEHLPWWDSESCLKEGWRAAAQAILDLQASEASRQGVGEG